MIAWLICKCLGHKFEQRGMIQGWPLRNVQIMQCSRCSQVEYWEWKA